MAMDLAAKMQELGDSELANQLFKTIAQSERERVLKFESEWSDQDKQLIMKSLEDEQFYLSESKQYIFYNGEAYTIYVPNYCQVTMDSGEPWEVIKTYENKVKEFDWSKAILGFAPGRVSIFDKHGQDVPGVDDTGIYVAGQVMSLGLNLGQAAVNAQSDYSITVNLLQRNGERRAIIAINDSNYNALLASYAGGQEQSVLSRMFQKCGDGAAEQINMKRISSGAQKVYQDVTGVKDEGGIYDFVVTMDERHADSSHIGYISFEEEKAVYTPLVYPQDKVEIGIRGDMTVSTVAKLFRSTEIIYDVTDLYISPKVIDGEYEKYSELIGNTIISE